MLKHPSPIFADRSLEPIHMNIVIAAIDGEIAVKRLHYLYGKPTLVAENDSCKPTAFASPDGGSTI